MNITLYSSLFSKEASAVIDAQEWVKAIRDGKYKTTVEQIRALIEQNRKDQASELKLKLPAVVYGGVCRTGRFYKDTTERTGWAMFDIDNMLPEQVRAVRELLEVFPWVVILHTTSSGRGIRIVVNIGMVHIDVYRDAYEKVAARIKELTGMDLDMACKDFARASLASYDPDIYYNPDATVFDYGEDYNPLNYTPVCGPDTSEDFRVPKNVFANEAQPQATYTPAQHTAGNEAEADPVQVIDRFFSNNTYTTGSRHKTLLRLGGYIRWRRIKEWQLNEAIAIACGRAVQPGVTAKEARAAIIWGYYHGTEGGKGTADYGQRVQNNNMNLSSTVNLAENACNEELTEEEIEEEEVIEEQCTPLDDNIYEHLPDELKKLLVIAKDRRERDITLLSAICISSSLFPALRTIYGNKKYSAHLYICFVAEAGAGKGVAMYAPLLASKIDKELDNQYRKAKKEYEKKLLEWELELRTCMKEKRMPDIEKKPVEPVRQSVIVSPNTSKSQLIIDVKASGEEGLAIVTSEIDAMIEALRTDYGNHAAELRMFFHHEEVRQRFKIDKEPIVIKHPRVTMLMTGTHDQVVSLFKSTENGLYSRFLFYMMNDTVTWKSQSPLDNQGGIDVEELYGELGEKLKSHFFNSRGKEVMIKFTRAQWDMHNEIFETRLGMVVAEGKKSSGAMVKRSGLIAIRVAMVLCGYRIMEAGWQTTEYTCTDEDFNTAIHIALTGIVHSAHVSTMMKEMEVRGKVKNYFKLLPILHSMKKTFRYSDFKKATMDAGFNESAAKRALKKYVQSGLLSKSNGFYTKTSKLK